MKRITFLLIITGLFLLLNYCSNEQKNAEDFTIYPVDTSLVSNSINSIDFGISLNPPRNWKELNSEMPKQSLQSDNGRYSREGFIYTPTRLFLNKSKNSTLFFGIVTPKQKSDSGSHDIEEYKDTIEKMFANEIVSAKDLMKNSFSMYEFVIKRENLISYKILLVNKKDQIIQLDYTTLEKYFPTEHKFIESSIGSIVIF